MKISVITPSFNSADYIERAIQSVLEQGYDDFEHIIMDNCSTDGTLDIIKKYPHIRWKSEKDNGQSDAMNKGFELSTGEIIVYLNCDDYFLPGAFEAVVPYFEAGEMFVVGNLIMIDLKGNEHIVSPNVDHKKMLKHWLPESFPNNPVQYFYRREVQQNIPFNLDNHTTMDVEYLMEASSRYTFKKIDRTLGVYPLLPDAKSIVASQNIYNYWTFENFSYVDKYLLAFSKEEIMDFKREQQKAYLFNVLNIINKKQQPIASELMERLEELSKVSFFRAPVKKYYRYKEMLRTYHEQK
jgi:glycosyltransferase involved in cell wall biosynthesis